MHLPTEIPWDGLSQYISLGSLKEDDTAHFFIRCPTDNTTRRTRVLQVIHALARSIALRADEKTQAVPKPDASFEEFQAVGVVDGSLFFAFPPQLDPQTIDHLKIYNPQIRTHSEDWVLKEHTHAGSHAVFILNCLADASQSQHFPIFMYLAQRPRVPFYRMFNVDDSVDDSVHGSPSVKDGGIGNYMKLTIQHYVFVNLLLALGGPEILERDIARYMDCFPSGNYMCPIFQYLDDDLPFFYDTQTHRGIRWFSTQGDPLHNAFWNLRTTQGERLEINESSRSAYLERCLDTVAACYALIVSSVETNTALNRSDIQYGFDDLVSTIVTVFRSFGGAFHLPSSYSIQVPRYPIRHPQSSCMDDTQKSMLGVAESNSFASRAPSFYLELPPELHLHILSLIPSRDILALSIVCQRMRGLCTQSLYAYVFSLANIGSPVAPGSISMQHLCTFLESRDDLRRYVLYAPLSFTHDTGASNASSRFDGLGIPFFHPLASLLPNLREVTLTLRHPISEPSQNSILYAVLSILQERSPFIQSLQLDIGSYTQSEIPDDVERVPSEELSRLIARSSDSIHPSWALHRLTLVIDPESHPLPLRSLVLSSASTLRFLSLSIYESDFDDIAQLPEFVNVRELRVITDIGSYTLQAFISHFPSLIDLDIADFDARDPENDDMIPIDFGKCAPRMQHLKINGYSISGFSPAIQTVDTTVLDRSPSGSASERPSPDVKALRLGMEYTGIDAGRVEEISTSYPSLLSFEMTSNILKKDSVMTTFFVNHVLDMWPLLETFVIDVGDFSCRPRRRDYPNLDDGIDEQKRLVMDMFKKHSNLKVVSLSGVPPEIENNPYIVPKRVWKRDGDGASMVGREAIRWKFDSLSESSS